LRPGERIDWGRLARVWSSEGPRAELQAQLEEAVRRRTRAMRFTVAVEVAIIAGLIVLSRWYLGPAPSALQMMLIATTWIWAGVLESFAVWNRLGSWRADSQGVNGYIRLLERRAIAKQRVARAIVPLTLVQCVIVLLLLIAVPDGDIEQSWRAPWLGGGVLVAVMAAVAAWARWYARSAQSELLEIEATRRLVRDDEEAFPPG
jgi:hypothetical protein